MRSMRSMLGRWKWSCPTETGHNDKHHIVWCVVSPLVHALFQMTMMSPTGTFEEDHFWHWNALCITSCLLHPARPCIWRAYHFWLPTLPPKRKKWKHIYILRFGIVRKNLYIYSAEKPLYIYIEIWDSAKKPGKKTKLSVWINIWLNHDKSQYIATPK
jgi:hypothetical protein